MSTLKEILLAQNFLNEELTNDCKLYFLKNEYIFEAEDCTENHLVENELFPVLLESGNVFIRPLNDKTPSKSQLQYVKKWAKTQNCNLVHLSKKSQTSNLFESIREKLELPTSANNSSPKKSIIKESVSVPTPKSIETSESPKISLKEYIVDDEPFSKYFPIDNTPKKELTLKEQILIELQQEIDSKYGMALRSSYNPNTIVGIGGGGTVAKQFADGGTMNGDLTVNGTFRATTIIGGAELPSPLELSAVKYTPLASTPAYEQGLTFFDNEDHALTFYTDIDGVSQQIGQESWIRVVNNTGSTITNGKVVYISGVQGNRPKIGLATDTDPEIAHKTIGVATHDIANNAEGFITTFGIVREINTSGFTEGDELYLSANGNFTNIKPASPTHAIKIGYALNSTPNGLIFVTIIHGNDLDNLHDVSISSPRNGDTLVYNSSLSAWRNYSLDPILVSSDYTIPLSTISDTTFVLSASSAFTVIVPDINLITFKKINFKSFSSVTISCWGDQKMDGIDNSKILTSPNSITLEKFGQLPDIDWLIR